MPTYTYACTQCGHTFDIRQSFTDDPLTDCPECADGAGGLRKVIHPVGIAFKGSGFYKTDSRASGKGPKSTSGKGGGDSSGGSGDSSSSSSDSSAGSSDSSSGSAGSSTSTAGSGSSGASSARSTGSTTSSGAAAS